MIIKRKEFVANNLQLREVSSRCISKYKESQAFALGELDRNTTHKFSKTAREILLLKYDTWFKWLVEVEDVLRRHSISEENIVGSVVIEISDDLEREYIGILNAYSKVFQPAFVEVWLKAHTYMYSYLRRKIQELPTADLKEFMISATNLLICIMDNTLFELYEIDNLFDGGGLFVSFDTICLDYGTLIDPDACLLGDRLEVYDEYFLDLGNELVIKDYSPDMALRDDKIRAATTKRLRDKGYIVKGII